MSSSTPTLEESLRRYLMSFDGKKKEFSPSVKRAFDSVSVYHKEFYNRTSKYTISRDELLQIQIQHLTSGTRVLLVSFHPISSSRILYKLCIIPNCCYGFWRTPVHDFCHRHHHSPLPSYSCRPQRRHKPFYKLYRHQCFSSHHRWKCREISTHCDDERTHERTHFR